MTETVFTYAGPALKFGAGASAEVAHDLASYGARRVLLVTDVGVAATGHPGRIADQVRAAGIDVVVYDRARVEPTDASLAEAAAFARDAQSAVQPFDAVLAVGGGSAIDTGKAVDLLLTNPGDLSDYLNAPIGRGRAPEQPLLPLVAVPTTTGTGSESTTVCVLDVLSLHVKTGISHPAMRPRLAVVDPLLSLSQPATVTAASGMDILCHALESYTAKPYTAFEAKRPDQRVPYCGANPVSDMWSERALALLAASFRGAVEAARRGEAELGPARADMALAATYAGLGFANAGVHVPHANAYPIAGRVRDYRPPDYPSDEAMVPHGMAVGLTAPAAFRWTFAADPDRHLRAARLLGADGPDGPDTLALAVTSILRDVGMPNGLAEVGYEASDVDDLVAGSLQQERLLATAPRRPAAEDLAGVFAASMEHW